MQKEKASKAKFRNNNKSKPTNYKTILMIILFTFTLTVLFSYIFAALMEKASLQIAFIVLLIIIAIGVAADGIGNAVVTAEETPFHSMAAQKVKGAKESILLIRNAPSVANFFNDVVGDICGVISGTAAAAIVLQLEKGLSFNGVLFGMVMSGFVASMTVGGKAIGKGLAISHANSIVYNLGLLSHLLGIGNMIKTKK